MSERYAKVRAIYISSTRDAVMVDCNIKGKERSAWIPKSLIHSADLSKFTHEMETEIVDFRLMEWKAEELDL